MNVLLTGLSALLAASTALATEAPQPSKQMILVKPALNATTPFAATVELRQQDEQGKWNVVVGPFAAVVGKNGFAAEGEKREGDGKSPSGVFALGLIFGYEETPTFTLKMPYRQATEQDFWVDDVASAEYNQWMTGTPNATSWENMRRADDLYSIGAVIEYNTKPITPGYGSAIFFHVWRNAERPTAGCVAMHKTNLISLFSALDSSLQPQVVMNPLTLMSPQF